MAAQRDIHQLWQAHFRQGAGALTSHFLRALRDERRLLGWRSGATNGVSVPPVHGGAAGEWVDVGPGARLVAHVPPSGDDGDTLGLLAIDGAEGCSTWRVRSSVPLRAGMRLEARWVEERSGSPLDLWFEPEART
jgi:hypothetical protein